MATGGAEPTAEQVAANNDAVVALWKDDLKTTVRERLVARIHVASLDGPWLDTLAAIKPFFGGAQLVLDPSLLESTPVLEIAEATAAVRGKDYHTDHLLIALEVAGGSHAWPVADVAALHKLSVSVVGPGVIVEEAAAQANTAAANTSNSRGWVSYLDEADDARAAAADGGAAATDAVSCFVGCLRSDRPDNLFPTVVCDKLGVALGLVYSTAESLRASVRCGRGVYWSRSRQQLWRKGDTSGAWQDLHRIDLDCDSDAIRFTVVQNGSPACFCHRPGCRTCWSAGAHCGGIGHLERTLASRLACAPVGSYTKRLFEDPDLLRNKILEEGQELVEATEPDHVAAEAADLLYFALVRCAAAGVAVADIEKHLDHRATKLKRRPGNAKAYRIAAAEAALGDKK
mmetsp:Transcript_56289/g.155329  ORF Transcript_56289/g.155329 Transcript_56289/m.155329 type:complete len:401 (+) Transcript_56289:687-1889(+)